MTTNQYQTLTIDMIDERIEQAIRDIVDGYFGDRRVDRLELADRLEEWTMQIGIVLPTQIDCPAMERIVSIARRHKRDSA